MDDRKLFKRYSHLAVAAAAVVGLHPRQAFGSPEDLLEKFGAPRYEPSAQRLHIRKLMRAAIHPLTGRKGISGKDLRPLSSVATLDRPKHSHLFDSADIFEERTGKINSFHINNSKDESHSAGDAADWALDLATILDRPVEEVFKYDATLIANKSRKRRKRNEVETYDEEESDATQNEDAALDSEKLSMGQPYSLPLDRPARLKAANNLSGETRFGEEVLDDHIVDEQLRQTIAAYLLHLTPREEYVIRMRFGIGMQREFTLEEVGNSLNVTGARVGQIEVRGFNKIRRKNQIAIGEIKTDKINELMLEKGQHLGGQSRRSNSIELPVVNPSIPEQPSETARKLKRRRDMLEAVEYMNNINAINFLISAQEIPAHDKGYFAKICERLRAAEKEKGRASPGRTYFTS